MKRMEALKGLTAAVQAKDAAATEKAYAALPPDMQADRTVIMLRLQGLMAGDVAAYLRVLDQAVQKYGDGIVGPFVLFDQYFTQDRHDAALAVIDRLDKQVADPYLDFYRALAHKQKGDAAAAKKLLDRVIAAAPELGDAYQRRIGLALADRDFPLVVRLIAAAEQRARLTFDAEKMKTVDVYAEFVKSPEYAKWVQQKKPAAGGAGSARPGGTSRPAR
jgi:hypothetical protein